MDEKEEDKSAESRDQHIKYYRSLNEMISKMRNEVNVAKDEAVKKHLDNRIDALNKDKKRIEQMFPEIDWDEASWTDL